MNRTTFLIDGFNLYHSAKNASIDLNLKGKGTRWLNIHAMCSSYLHAIGNNAQIADIYYFSALAKHIEAFKPDVVARHLKFIRCLEATGIAVELARFKKKNIPCPHCNQNIKRYEEKETDVATAAKLLEVLFLDQCDTVVLVTGDTDIVPAVKTAKRLFPGKNIAFLLPYKRHNQELAKLVSVHFEIKKETYARHQFPDPFVTAKGKQIIKSTAWWNHLSDNKSLQPTTRFRALQGALFIYLKCFLLIVAGIQRFNFISTRRIARALLFDFR